MKKLFENSTSKAFIISNILSCPFWGVFDILPIIICKELHATPFQITTIIALKPLSALFASYWSSPVFGKQHRLVKNLFWAYVLKFSPFLFIPFFSNPWLFILAFGLHMLLLRGMTPSWMELLKINLHSSSRSKICATGSTVNYIGNALFPFLFGFLLDNFQDSWRLIFPITSLLGISSICFINKIPRITPKKVTHLNYEKESFKDHLFKPWKTATNLLIKRPDFLRFQLGFFLGGAGLMTIHAILPKYFTETLNLSYTKILLAICFCKGVGFATSSPLWVKLFNRIKIFSFCARIPLIAALFPVLLIFAKVNLVFVFIAYLLYGIMQGGSELGWKMSGPAFAQEKDSAPYSSINVLAVGIRGGIFPYLGTLLLLAGSSYLVLTVGGLFCIAGSLYLWIAGKKYSLPAELSKETLKTTN
ncbi:MAG: MFS transporter [Simkaniaceae bacterium]|nr:MAG: MFS transporter [Simkaniaceae bacterium]